MQDNNVKQDQQHRAGNNSLSRRMTAFMAAAAVMSPLPATAQVAPRDDDATPAATGSDDLPPTPPEGGDITITLPAAPDSSAPVTSAGPRFNGQPLMANYQLSIDPPSWGRDRRFAELVLDVNTGEVVYERNGTDNRHIASMTKVMTAYLVFQAIEDGRLSSDTMLTVSPAAANILRRTMRLGLRAGQRISVDEALHAMISMSAGDAAVVLAEAVSGSERAFAEDMTTTAHRLGAVNSSFGTASGITGDESSAYDIAVIFSTVSRSFPDLYAQYFSPPTVNISNRDMPNCRLCEDGLAEADIGATGQKTGTREVSGSSIVVEIENGDRRYIVVAMGAPSSSARLERAVTLAQAVWNSPLPARQQAYMAAVANPNAPDR